MLKLKILSVGKTKEKWLDEAFGEYQKRLKPLMQVDCQWAKDSSQLLDWALKEPYLICLDPTGCLLSSEQFATLIEQSWDRGGSRLTIVIGGAEGLPLELKQNAQLISLSPLTFTHQITRLVLIEQIYRATEIQKGSNYHK
ncbi:SPOUT methyltransferase family protein [Candidatus Protochlamydia naegleriophila]|uniref:Ribosomal RNA large subunit methyltransferase H n=1 Tax=Candidatus Protochlamydia naegleriophila TaxID=389348 RepID=A0A0U5JCM2_9BACT|nr:23S rRNA (pseudouridine(1915)-N(3))-methyltransferase RlmH [Candidatus Protochlamydia naegleriophila]CUI16548.1 SPOUT methyltransferase family protein [Candidatus Protochlamydia naegleriophila]